MKLSELIHDLQLHRKVKDYDVVMSSDAEGNSFHSPMDIQVDENGILVIWPDDAYMEDTLEMNE